MSDINMTPLIDIVLVVLIIMMVNIPIQIEALGLKLPGLNPPPTTDLPPPDQLVISVYKPEKEGDAPKIALNRKIMGQQEMEIEITRRLKPMANKNVFVDADKVVPYGLVVDMVDLSRKCGAVNVGLAKMKEEGPLPATSVSVGAGMPRGVILGSPRVVGAITEAKAYESIAPLEGSLTQCYLQRLAVRPDLTGTLVIKAEVGPSGELLSEPSIETDEVGDADLATCVTGLLPNLRFGPLKAVGDFTTAGIRYSVLFSPG
ncbi:MAG: biopolymer transporter ExbD [Myxococcota bacterium]